jgi:hypothetical protein
MLISHRKQFDQQITKAYQEVKMPSLFWIKQQLLHPLIMNLILPVYKLLIGKVLLVGLQKVKILSMAVHRKAKALERNPLTSPPPTKRPRHTCSQSVPEAS